VSAGAAQHAQGRNGGIGAALTGALPAFEAALLTNPPALRGLSGCSVCVNLRERANIHGDPFRLFSLESIPWMSVISVQAALLASLFELGSEFAAAIDLHGPDRERHALS
jgi:hypothetical protein